MIEFKGDCGHLIRARDEDAGKLVRCSYCGREAVVARPVRADDPSALLDEVEQTGVIDSDATRAQRRSHRQKARADKRLAAGKSAEVDPFAVILKMTYVAIILVIGAVAWKYVPPLYQELAGRQATPAPTGLVDGTALPAATREPARTPSPVSQKRGLVGVSLDVHPDGAYVASVPTQGLVLHVPECGNVDAVFDKVEGRSELQSNALVKLTPGRHTIAVAVKINEPALMRMPGYPDLRRALESSSNKQDAAKRLGAWLLPDNDVAQRLVRIGKYTYIARVYEVEVNNTWVGITALFVPRAPLSEVVRYLPPDRNYAFESADVERELGFYEVPAGDRIVLMDVLARVGRISYRSGENERYRVYQIDPVDGAVTTEALGF